MYNRARERINSDEAPEVSEIKFLSTTERKLLRKEIRIFHTLFCYNSSIIFKYVIRESSGITD